MKRTIVAGMALGLAAALCVGMLSGTVFAATKPAQPPAKSPPAPPPPPPPAPAKDPGSSGTSTTGDTGSVLSSEVTRLDAAKKILAQAQTDFDALVMTKKAEFEAGADYQAAKRAVDEDEKALATAKAPLQEKLKASDPGYAAALVGLEPAKKQLEEAIASKKADEITIRKYDVQHMQSVIKTSENAVFSKDAAVVAAQQKLDADKPVLAAMQKKFIDFLNANPDYTAMSMALANAQARVTALNANAATP